MNNSNPCSNNSRQRYRLGSPSTGLASTLPLTLAALVLLGSTWVAQGAGFRALGKVTYRTYSLEGTVEATWTKEFEAVVEGNLSYVSSSGDGMAVSKYEYYGDGTNSYRLTHVSQPVVGQEVVEFKSGKITTNVISEDRHLSLIPLNVEINPWVVPIVDMSFTTPVWLAYCSTAYFQSRTANQVLPITILMHEVLASGVTVPAKWTLHPSEPNLLERVVYLSDGKQYRAGPDGRLEAGKPKAAFHGWTTNVTYTVSQWTNASGFTVPQQFQLTILVPRPGARQSADLIMASSYDGYLTELHPSLHELGFPPSLPPKVRVTERRFTEDPIPIGELGYTSTNGRIRSIADLKDSPKYIDRLNDILEEQRRAGRRTKMLVVLCITAALPVLILLLRRIK